MTQLFMVHPELKDALAVATTGLAPRGTHALRPATAADAEGLATLLSAAYDEYWDAARVHSVLLDAPDVRTTYLIEEDGEIVATASARYLDDYPASGYLHYVAADAARAGRGLGLEVTVAVLREFEEQGLSRAVLETDDFRVPAVITYLRLGFVPEYRDEVERLAWSQLMRVFFQKKAVAK